MKTLPMLMLLFLMSVACDDKKDRHGLQDGNLTVQLFKKTIDGDLRAMLMLCDGNECRNTLRYHNGDEFYFPKNHADRRSDYNFGDERGNYYRTDGRDFINRVRSNYANNPYFDRNQGYGVVITNNGRGWRVNARARYDARVSTRIRGQLDWRRNDAEIVLVGYDRNGEPVYRTRDDRRYYRNDLYDLARGGVVAERLELMRAVAEDTYWRNKEQSLQQLFVHGEAIRVHKNELHSLLSIVAQRFNAVIDTEVQDFLNRR